MTHPMLPAHCAGCNAPVELHYEPGELAWLDKGKRHRHECPKVAA